MNAPYCPDNKLLGIQERRDYCLKEIKRISQFQNLQEDQLEALELWKRSLKDIDELIKQVKAMNHYISVNIH